jgi:hypothetical protein
MKLRLKMKNRTGSKIVFLYGSEIEEVVGLYYKNSSPFESIIDKDTTI